jgi:Tol biopolymer transport system component
MTNDNGSIVRTATVLRRALAMMLWFLAAAGAARAGEIAFVRDGRLYTIAPDGSGELLVPGAPDGAELPQWSPAGGEVAYVSITPRLSTDTSVIRGLPGWIFALVVVPVDPPGPARELLRVGLAERDWSWQAREVKWSDDGTWVGFSAASGEFFEEESVWIAPLGDGPARRYGGRWWGAGFEPAARRPSWVTPDGRRLVSRNVNGLDELFVVTEADTVGRQLTRSGAVRDTGIINEYGSADISGVWSPDFARVLFRPFTVAGDYLHGPLMAVDPDGSGQQLLGDDCGYLDEFPTAWSPDLRRLAFEVEGELFVTDFESPPRRLGVGAQPDWRR